ncbi:MAG: ABC-type transport auxiliary lipoprotein family protein [Nevskiales bacterium]
MIHLRAGLIFILLLLAACVGNTPLPDEHFYRLSIPPPAERTATAQLQGLVVVEPPRAPDVYTERALVYSDDAESISLQHYHYHFWIDPPPLLLQQELIRYLEMSHPAATITTGAGSAQPGYRISSTLRRFERLKSGQGWMVAVTLRLQLENASKATPLLVRDYEQLLPATDTSLEASVHAFSVATGNIFGQFARDLVKALPE